MSTWNGYPVIRGSIALAPKKPLTIVVHESSGVSYRAPRQLAHELSKTTRTLLVGAPERPSMKRLLGLPSTRAVTDRLLQSYSPPQLPRRWGLSRLSDPFSRRMWAREIRCILGDESPDVVIFDRPSQHQYAGQLGERLTAYYAHCDYTVDILGRQDASLLEHEEKLLAQCDIVFAASPELLERFAATNQNVIHLPCSYNPELFKIDSSAAVPAVLRNIPRPRILLAGLIGGRVDFNGLLTTAQANPEFSIVLAGPVSANLESQLVCTGRSSGLFQKLLALENVYYLGAFPHEAVPAIMSSCDVGLVPYCLTAFTLTSSPVKAFEYLAMGKPVVATAAPETVALGENVIVVPEGGDFGPGIRRALKDNTGPGVIESRLASVAAHSIVARANTVLHALQTAMNP